MMTLYRVWCRLTFRKLDRLEFRLAEITHPHKIRDYRCGALTDRELARVILTGRG